MGEHSSIVSFLSRREFRPIFSRCVVFKPRSYVFNQRHLYRMQINLFFQSSAYSNKNYSILKKKRFRFWLKMALLSVISQRIVPLLQVTCEGMYRLRAAVYHNSVRRSLFTSCVFNSCQTACLTVFFVLGYWIYY